MNLENNFIIKKDQLPPEELKVNRQYEIKIDKQVTYSCINQEIPLWINNKGFGLREIGKVKIIHAIHLPELISGKIHTLVKYKVLSLK